MKILEHDDQAVDFGRPYGAIFCQFAASCSAPEARVALHPSNSEEPEMASPGASELSEIRILELLQLDKTPSKTCMYEK
jgi:hypothetical protein